MKQIQESARDRWRPYFSEAKTLSLNGQCLSCLYKKVRMYTGSKKLCIVSLYDLAIHISMDIHLRYLFESAKWVSTEKRNSGRLSSHVCSELNVRPAHFEHHHNFSCLPSLLFPFIHLSSICVCVWHMLSSLREITMGQKILTSQGSFHSNSEDIFYSQRSKSQGRESLSTVGDTGDM